MFLESGSRGLKRSGRDPTERELVRTRAKVGELMMKLELATGLLCQVTPILTTLGDAYIYDPG